MEIRQTRKGIGTVEIRAQLFPLFGKVAKSFSCGSMKGKAETAFMRVDGKVRPFKAQ